jgi:hypothetical protein
MPNLTVSASLIIGRVARFLLIQPGLPDFSSHNIPKGGKIYQIVTKLFNGHKMYQMAIIYSKRPNNMPIFSIPRTSKIYPI